MYVADRGRHCVLVMAGQRSELDRWGGPGSSPGQFRLPCGIAVRHGGFVYVSDSGNDRVQKLTNEGEVVTMWGQTGSEPGAFRSPYGIALDIEENVYVADCDNHRVQQFTSTGELIRMWGANGGDGGGGTAPGQFLQPRGVGVDGLGNVYVAEYGGNRIQRFGPEYLAAI